MLNKPINSAIPVQQVSYKTKFLDKKDDNGHTPFMKDTMDSLEAIGRYSFWNNEALYKNYQIMQGRFNVEDYVDAFDANDLSSIIYQEMKLPSFLKHYDITTKAVKLIIGEFIKRPDITRVVAKDITTSNEKLRIKSDLVWSFLNQAIEQEITPKLIQMGLDPNKDDFQNEEEAKQYKDAVQQKYQELTPQSIEKYLTYDFRSAGEHWGQATLSNDIERLRLKEQDTVEMYDHLVVDRAFSHLYLTASGYGMETWNPVTVFYQHNTQNKNIEDLAYVGRTLYMSKEEIIDSFGWRMTQEQLESLYPDYQKGEGQGGSVYKEAFNATMYPFADYREYSNLSEAVGIGLEQGTQDSLFDNKRFGVHGGSTFQFTQGNQVQVTQAYWKSQRKVGKLNAQNPETGETTVQIVDETFNPKLFGVEVVKDSYNDSDEPNTVCWTWITEVWQGIKVNVNYQKIQSSEDRNSIYIDIKPCEFQFRGNDPRLIYNSKLPVCGSIFNNRNGKSQSMVDLLKPYQVLVNAFNNQAYHVAQKNNGKFFLMGASLLPNIKDLGGEDSQEKFMTTVQNLGLGIVDDSTSAQAQSMQYGLKVMDMDESDRISRLINLGMLVEQQGFMQLGITPQRQGIIQASETATATSVGSNSYAITEIYFENFNNYRRRKLQMLLELAQYVESEGEGDIVKQYTTSDLGQAFIKVAKSDLLLRDIGVYLVNSAEQQRKKELVEQLLLKNNQSLMPLSKLIETIRLDSLADVQKKLEEQEKEMQQQQQAAEESKQKHEQEMLQAQLAEKQKDRDLAKYKIDTDNNTKLELANLQGIANEGSFDQTGNTLDQLATQKDLAIKENKVNSDNATKQMQLVNQQIDSFRKSKLEESKMKQDRQLKESEHKAKQGIEDQKLKQIESQSKNQEKLAKDKHESDLKLQEQKRKAEMDKADRELEMKKLDREMKLLDLESTKKKAELDAKAFKTKIQLEKEMGQVKMDAIIDITEVKVDSAEKLAKIKNKEGEQQFSYKMEEQSQKHEHKLVENTETHKQKLKQIKIKPKLNKKK